MATPAVSQLHWKKSAACSTPMRLPFWLRTPDFHIPQGYQGRSPCLVSGLRTIELDIHSHSALACLTSLPGSRPNMFWGQVSFKLEKILKKGETDMKNETPRQLVRTPEIRSLFAGDPFIEPAQEINDLIAR